MKRGLILTALVATVLLGTLAPGQCAWTLLGADAGRSGFTAETPELPMSTLWKFYYPDSHTQKSLAVDGNRAYFSASKYLFCLDINNGARLWEASTKGKFRASPAIVGDYVVLGDDQGILHAFDKNTGQVRWMKELGSSISAPILFYNGKIFVGTIDNKVLSLVPESGELVWSYKTEGAVNLPLSAAGGIVYAEDGKRAIHAIDATSGKLRWSAKSESALVVPIVATEEMAFMVSGSYLYALNTRGAVVWSIYSDRNLSSAPAVKGDELFVTGSDGRLYAMKSRSGAIKWVYEDPEVELTSSPSVAGDTILVGGTKGTMLAVGIDKGDLLWQCQGRSLDTPIYKSGAQSAASQPVYADGKILVLFNDGNLTCFSSDAYDISGPIVTAIGPSGQKVVSGRFPIIMQARIYDEGSGLDEPSIEVYLDGEKGVMEKDPKSGAYFYVLSEQGDAESISDGAHTVTLTAKDYRGNVTAVSWKFATDSSITSSQWAIPEALRGAAFGSRGQGPPTSGRSATSGGRSRGGGRSAGRASSSRGSGFSSRSSRTSRTTSRRSSSGGSTSRSSGGSRSSGTPRSSGGSSGGGST